MIKANIDELDTREYMEIFRDARASYKVLATHTWMQDCLPFALAETTIVNLVGWRGLFDMIDCNFVKEMGYNCNGIMVYDFIPTGWTPIEDD